MSSGLGFQWRPEFELGFAKMDTTHREFVDLVRAMLACSDEELPAALDRFAAHAHSHFELERICMTETAFPSAQCHLDEHAAVLKSIAEVQAVVREGRINVARALAQELARWFPGHAESMDLGLAKWMVNLRLGGAPVMIRRKQQV